MVFVLLDRFEFVWYVLSLLEVLCVHVFMRDSYDFLIFSVFDLDDFGEKFFCVCELMAAAANDCSDSL